jgi:hypothetical protein
MDQILTNTSAVVGLLSAASITLLCVLISTRKNLKKSESTLTRFQGIIDIEAHIEELKEKGGEESRNIERLKKKYIEIYKQELKNIEILKEQYKEKRKVFEALVKEASIYDETISLGNVGHYKPHFDYDTSESYKEALLDAREVQKRMIKNEDAMHIITPMTLDGSASKGLAMQKRLFKMAIRAFNNECDAAIANARWNNMDTLEKRINKSFEMLNKYNSSTSVAITSAYLYLKIKELRIVNEYKVKLQEEKEEQAAIRQIMREEAALQKEIDQAAKEEDKYQKLLAKAQKEAEKAVGSKLDEVNEKIEGLEKDLEDAHSKNERAKSMAEQTKRGHVYVISNIGSFGEDVFKIGMTRRLEPLDRVKELGDASVPFIFDVHAMIYSDNAPALESMLHKEFSTNRVNLVNNRKEFFNLSLDDIKNKVSELSVEAEFILTASAEHYHESKAIRAEKSNTLNVVDIFNAHPESI